MSVGVAEVKELARRGDYSHGQLGAHALEVSGDHVSSAGRALYNPNHDPSTLLCRSSTPPASPLKQMY
ncbi:hypothetical protein NQZ68_032989 [Dissostichus eleginoides]|nr:hypothetical protein NQZ68_032989 [Dissostichus eleginoides]